MQFDVSLSDASDKPNPANTSGRGPKIYRVKLKKVAEINPVYVLEVSSPNVGVKSLSAWLHRFLEGVQSHDNDVLTAITVSAYDVSSPVLRILMDTPVKGFECCHSHGTNAVRMIQVVATEVLWGLPLQ